MTSSALAVAALAGLLASACGHDEIEPELADRLAALAWDPAPPPPDPTNRWADDAAAAALGQRLFFDTRFAGPLLDVANTGLAGTLGAVGDVQRVSCAGCHVPDSKSFVDTRTARGQISLAAGWTHRRTPALLDLGGVPFLGWDGRRATGYGVVFGVVDSPVELNSSRLFVAQQVVAGHRAEYEAIFGALPALAGYAPLAAAEAGCAELPADPRVDRCVKPGHDDPEVIRVVVNVGKALAAYTRRLGCGPSRFDAWIAGDAGALDSDEAAGAALFVGRAGCVRCHDGPRLTDDRFHNVGTPGGLLPFTGVDTSDDPGAADGLAAARVDPLGPGGAYSDGDDGRLDAAPTDAAALLGAFRTPSLRCLGSHPAFMHDGELRSLEDVVRMFDAGGGTDGFVGTPEIEPLGLSPEERAQLVAFLRALDGPGPDPALLIAP
jgi:cytochrome c peroxidase